MKKRLFSYLSPVLCVALILPSMAEAMHDYVPATQPVADQQSAWAGFKAAFGGLFDKKQPTPVAKTPAYPMYDQRAYPATYQSKYAIYQHPLLPHPEIIVPTPTPAPEPSLASEADTGHTFSNFGNFKSKVGELIFIGSMQALQQKQMKDAYFQEKLDELLAPLYSAHQKFQKTLEEAQQANAPQEVIEKIQVEMRAVEAKINEETQKFIKIISIVHNDVEETSRAVGQSVIHGLAGEGVTVSLAEATKKLTGGADCVSWAGGTIGALVSKSILAAAYKNDLGKRHVHKPMTSQEIIESLATDAIWTGAYFGASKGFAASGLNAYVPDTSGNSIKSWSTWLALKGAGLALAIVARPAIAAGVHWAGRYINRNVFGIKPKKKKKKFLTPEQALQLQALMQQAQQAQQQQPAAKMPQTAHPQPKFAAATQPKPKKVAVGAQQPGKPAQPAVAQQPAPAKKPLRVGMPKPRTAQ